MTTNIPSKKAKRIAAATLVGLLLLLGIAAVVNQVDDVPLFAMLGLGALLGGWYAVRGTLPTRIYRSTDSIWNSGGRLVEDDAPGNISSKIYVPIILIAIVAATVAIVVAIRWL